MDLAKRLVETFREMAEMTQEAECFTVNIIYNGEESEFTFTAEELQNMSDHDMEKYLSSLIERNYH